MSKQIKYNCVKTDEGFKVFGAEALKRDCENLPNGIYRITVDKKASQEQFGWLYGVCYIEALKGFVDAGYEEFTSIDDVDYFFKLKFSQKELIDRETGEIVRIPSQKKKFSTFDEMVYGDKIVQWCYEWLGISIPPPDKEYRSKK